MVCRTRLGGTRASVEWPSKAGRGEEWGPGHCGKGMSFFFFGGAADIGSGKVCFLGTWLLQGIMGEATNEANDIGSGRVCFLGTWLLQGIMGEATNEANDRWRVEPVKMFFILHSHRDREDRWTWHVDPHISSPRQRHSQCIEKVRSCLDTDETWKQV